jgi:hypothetical protein
MGIIAWLLVKLFETAIEPFKGSRWKAADAAVDNAIGKMGATVFRWVIPFAVWTIVFVIVGMLVPPVVLRVAAAIFVIWLAVKLLTVFQRSED